MSLSQKHAGLILVPWFNSEEWRYVYQSVYSNDKDRQLKALELLKIWKLRTPVLSTGVEGTLILLEALLLDSDSLSSEHLSNLYSIALMRFLNLSAANSDKQGLFTRTSAKNELPKWLINLRHDIAHGHQIPSIDNLKMALDFGFQWLKEKYWLPQNKIIQDYWLEENSISSQFSTSLKAYVDLNVALFEHQESDNEYLEKIKEYISKKFKKTIRSPHLMLDVLLEMITRSLENEHQQDKLGLAILVSPQGLLRNNFEVLSTDEGNKESLTKDFRNIWQTLLNIYHRYGLLFSIIEGLFDVVGNISHTDNSKKMAALWLNEIFTALTETGEEADILTLDKFEQNYVKEATIFKKNVLYFRNQYTTYFIDSVLKYTNSKDDEDVKGLIKADFNSVAAGSKNATKIYTLDDLNISLEDALMEDFSANQITNNYVDNSARIAATNKWKKIEDTSMFKNCPLGILPHQIGQKRPLFV